MSERGAAGILARAGKVPAAPPELDLSDKTGEAPAASPEPKKKPAAKKKAPKKPSGVRGTARQNVTDEDVRAKLAAAKKADQDEGQGESKASKAGEAIGRPIGQTIGSGISYANQGAGFVLGLLVWGWLVRPFLTGGAPQVKAVLMAKFFNKGPDGKELP